MQVSVDLAEHNWFIIEDTTNEIKFFILSIHGGQLSQIIRESPRHETNPPASHKVHQTSPIENTFNLFVLNFRTLLHCVDSNCIISVFQIRFTIS